MKRTFAVIALLLLAASPASVRAQQSPPAPVPTVEASKEAENAAMLESMFKTARTALGREGVVRDKVMTITIPRDDLDVRFEDIDVPAAAGLESEFRFFQCPCGQKLVVIGQFVTADYEANDVVDALRAGHFVVASVGPLLMYEKPRLTLIRFQGEGKADELAAALKSALEWTGKQRNTPIKID